MKAAEVSGGLGSASAVLWDIDGTLLTSGSVAARAFLDAVEHVTGVPPQVEGIEFGGRIDPEIATLLLATTGHDAGHVPAVLKRLHDLVQQNVRALQAQTRALPGVRELIDRLVDAGIRQTVVTGNIRSVAAMKLAAAELVPPIDPEVGGYGDSGTTRAEVATASLVALFGPDWPAQARDCWIIGDTPRDLACAQALGLRCALVATGGTRVEDLDGLGADIVLKGLEIPTDAQRLWG
ncbi:haloacid dehalogenase-like hydrolase [Kineosporia sp. NBRC 101731]|uniref:HAD family hydrolase n=1 Tax=Kineosporia sp. NBRC 101731 TaxID=3032199 RepID=UPI0024A02DC2|nr:haloacid dehalogenase-like hydrolase [Kineosporia sp. NBRC 101731]GLY29466.1 hydrolase [Kineosporia sp. NBRC 101731]